MKKKIIYVSFSRLTDRISRDFHIDYLIENGVTVEYWDIVSLVREEHDDAGMKTETYLHNIKTFKEFESILSLSENRDALYVMLISCRGRFARVFRLLSRFGCRMVKIDATATPIIPKSKGKKILYHLFNPLSFLKIIYNNGKVNLYRRIKLIKPYDIIFAAGSVMMSDNAYAAKVVPINNIDYDHFNRVISAKERIVKGNYAVYLDVNIPFHNDHTIMGLPRVDPEIYYQSLNHFFELLESFYGIKVVIAAHPTADYNVETFKSRETYRLITAELVKDADFVISMHSTSNSYAVLNFKPVIFIYTNEMLSLYKENIMRYIYAFSNYLDSPIYNIDEIAQGKQVIIKDVNIIFYENYKYKFLTSPESEHTTTQEIFLREITS